MLKSKIVWSFSIILIIFGIYFYMDKFGKSIEIVKLKRVETICYSHKINRHIFLSNLLNMSIFVVFIFVVYNVANIYLKVVQ